MGIVFCRPNQEVIVVEAPRLPLEDGCFPCRRGDTLRSVRHTLAGLAQGDRLDKPPSASLRGCSLPSSSQPSNNNAFLLMVRLLAIESLAGGLDTSSKAYESISQRQTTTAFVAYTLPLCLLSLVAGYFADRWSKRSVIIGLKGLSWFCLVGDGGAVLRPGNRPVFLLLLALMGAVVRYSARQVRILPRSCRMSNSPGATAFWRCLPSSHHRWDGQRRRASEILAGPCLLAGLFLSLLGVVGLMAAEPFRRSPPQAMCKTQ